MCPRIIRSITIVLCAGLISVPNLQFAENNLPDYACIPFHTIDQLILLPATVEGKEGFLILDTGAPGLILNKKHFEGGRDLAIQERAVGIGGVVKEVLTRRVTFEMGPLTWRKEYARLFDLEHLEHSKRLTILGLLGNQALKSFELIIDFQARRIEFYLLDKKGAVPKRSSKYRKPDFKRGYRQKGHIPYLEVQIGAKQYRMGIDCGAGISLIDRSHRADLKKEMMMIRSIGIRGVANLVLSVAAADLILLRVGNLSYPLQGVAFVQLEGLNRLLPGPRLDGMLGVDFFSTHKTAINFKKREIHLWRKSTKFREVYVSNQKD